MIFKNHKKKKNEKLDYDQNLSSIEPPLMCIVRQLKIILYVK